MKREIVMALPGNKIQALTLDEVFMYESRILRREVKTVFRVGDDGLLEATGDVVYRFTLEDCELPVGNGALVAELEEDDTSAHQVYRLIGVDQDLHIDAGSASSSRKPHDGNAIIWCRELADQEGSRLRGTTWWYQKTKKFDKTTD